MKGKYVRQYRNKKGNLVFVYQVSGTSEQIEKFKAAQGDFYRESEDGKPLFFNSEYTSDNIDLAITQDGKRVIVDNSELEKAKSQVKAFGGDLGTAMATAKAQQLLGLGASVAAPATVTAPATPIGSM